MAKYTIHANTFLTILEGKTFEIEADSAKDAEDCAEVQLTNYINEKYPWADYDEIHTEVLSKED